GGGAYARVEDVVARVQVRIADAEVDRVQRRVDVAAREGGAELKRVRTGDDHRVRAPVREPEARRADVGDHVAGRGVVGARNAATGERDRVAGDAAAVEGVGPVDAGGGVEVPVGPGRQRRVRGCIDGDRA